MSSTQLVSTITSSSAIKSSATTKLLSTPPVITTIKATTKNTKSKFRPRLNPHELSSKIGQYLSPNLFPRGAIRNPVPPSLAYSRLPPPCAELDPSPTHRIRRFKKWRDVVPELRLVLLDPKRKGIVVSLSLLSRIKLTIRSFNQISNIRITFPQHMDKGSQETCHTPRCRDPRLRSLADCRVYQDQASSTSQSSSYYPYPQQSTSRKRQLNETACTWTRKEKGTYKAKTASMGFAC